MQGSCLLGSRLILVAGPASRAHMFGGTHCLENHARRTLRPSVAMTVGERGREPSLCAVTTSEHMGVHRVELQMNPKFLSRYGIHDTSDFRRLVKILPVHHIYFAKLNDDKVRRHLRYAGLSAQEIGRIIERIR